MARATAIALSPCINRWMSQQSPDAVCAAMARDQRAVFSRAQALAAGLSPSELKYRLCSKRLERVYASVYCAAGTPASWERDMMAVHLWAGDQSCVSHRAAARLLGFRGFQNAPLELSTVHNRRPPTTRLGDRAVTVHRVDEHLLPEISRVGDFPCTSVRRTLVDLAGTKHPFTESSLDLALLRQQTDVGAVWLLLEREWMHGRRGVRILRDLLISRTAGLAPTHSELEVRTKRLLQRAGMPPPRQQFPVQLRDAVIHVDFAYPEIKLAIEADSHAYHLNGKAFELDRRRDNEMDAIGWDVLRFTWAMLRFDSAYVLSLLEPYAHRLASLAR